MTPEELAAVVKLLERFEEDPEQELDHPLLKVRKGDGFVSLRPVKPPEAEHKEE